MRKSLLLILASIALISCKKNEDFDSFDFSYTGTFTESFSIKFTKNDTVYIRQHWTRNDIYENKSIPKSNNNYVAKLNETDRKKLFNYISKIDFTKFKNEYNQDYSDGRYFKLNIKRRKLNKTILVHSYKIPKEIDSLSRWIVDLKQRMKLVKSNKNVNFESAKGFLPPDPPKPKNKLQ